MFFYTLNGVRVTMKNAPFRGDVEGEKTNLHAG